MIAPSSIREHNPTIEWWILHFCICKIHSNHHLLWNKQLKNFKIWLNEIIVGISYQYRRNSTNYMLLYVNMLETANTTRTNTYFVFNATTRTNTITKVPPSWCNLRQWHCQWYLRQVSSKVAGTVSGYRLEQSDHKSYKKHFIFNLNKSSAHSNWISHAFNNSMKLSK